MTDSENPTETVDEDEELDEDEVKEAVDAVVDGDEEESDVLYTEDMGDDE